jgi:hypothetical protein
MQLLRPRDRHFSMTSTATVAPCHAQAPGVPLDITHERRISSPDQSQKGRKLRPLAFAIALFVD